MNSDAGAGPQAQDPVSPRMAGAVLRDVAQQATPVLVGRRPAPMSQPIAVAPVAPVASVESSPAPSAALAEVEAAGFARGLREGRAQGLREAPAVAHDEGYRKGFELGLQQGAAKGQVDGEAEVLRRAREVQDEVRQKIERVDRLLTETLAQFRAHFAERLEAAQEDMVDLCCVAVRQILGDEFTDRRQAVGAVRQAVTRWIATGSHGMGVGAVSVLVHPSDLELLQSDSSLAEWLLQRGLQDVAWEADQQVRMGGCLVRSDSGELDARFETQLASLHEIVRGVFDQDGTLSAPVAEAGGVPVN